MLVRGSSRKPGSIDEMLDGRLMARLERLDLRSRRMFPGKLQGERRSKQRGQSVEFEDFRNYVSGDDLRHVDWNVYARLDKLFIKIFQEEQDMALHLAIDASASMDAGDPVPAGTERRGSATKLEHSARLAMALGYLALAKQNRVTVSVFGAPGVRGVERLPDVRGRRQAHRLGGFLMDALWRGREQTGSAGVRAHASGEGGGFDDAMSLVAKMRVGTGVFVVLSDFMDPQGYERGLRALSTAGGYDTYCLQVLTAQELEPDPQAISGDVRLLDAETGRGAEVTITGEVVRRYRKRLADYIERLAEFCKAREMSHALVRTDASIESLVFETLRQRGMVG